MKVVIISCFDAGETRIDMVYNYFVERGHDVNVLISDFDHFKKNKRDKINQYQYINTAPYYKNISINRLYSHFKFSYDAFQIVEKLKPDLLYVLVPPNSLAMFASKYKKKHQKVKLIFDIIDLWPESIPLRTIKKSPTFTYWKEMRDKSLKFADFVILECDLYKTVLGDTLNGINMETVYLAKKEINVTSTPMLSEDEIHLAYLGSINNIIDIPKIKEIIVAINEIKPVTLHIIGDGESKQELIRAAELAGASVVYHGKIYDPQKKQDVFDKCHFGLNIMKNSVCVGLTIKSIDYFQHGIPIINNIQADTFEIISKFKVGVNILKVTHNCNLQNDIIKLLKEKIDIRKRCKIVFLYLFLEKKFMKKLDIILDNVLKIK